MAFLWADRAAGQLKASFTADKTGGCSPLTVSFTNTTTGASAAATYSWNFGNAKTSALPNPGTTYVNQQTYTVTLTVKDGTQTSVKTLTITVYKVPAVDFSVSPAQGCTPLPVNFTSNSTAGDGSIASYFWDFGDGTTQGGAGLGQISHSYTFAQTASVSLTITNSDGCYNTLQKQAVIIYPSVTAGFTADKTVVCQVTDAVQFTNTGTGGSPLTYSWDFGDGTTSTDANPSHVFNQKGIYTVKLTVTGPGGCSNTFTQTNYINVADFTTDFSIPSPLCQGSAITFTDKSSPAPNTGYGVWTYDDGGTSYTYNGTTSHTFSTPGVHTITLTNTYGACQQSVTKQVTILAAPPPGNFAFIAENSCGAPVTVNFQDNTASAVSWQWNFGDAGTSAQQSPAHTYTAAGIYSVQLTVTNASGCSSTTLKPVTLLAPVVYLSYISSTSPDGNASCTPFTMVFTARSNGDPIAAYSWDFGDGSTSTDAQPSHSFTTSGTYTILLHYTTQGGCKGTANYSSVHLYPMPVANFSISPGTTICGNDIVTFTDQSTGYISQWLWNFGDNAGQSTLIDPTYQYRQSGTYPVTLTVSNGTCSSTKTISVTVLPPFPRISGFANTCDGTRGLVTFTQQSVQALTWAWDFGDGSSVLSLTADQPGVQHLYTKTGVYKIVLTTTNGGCSVRDSIDVGVLLKQSPLLTAATQEVCAGNNLNVSISNLEVNPLPDYYSLYGYTFAGWQYADGTSFTGSYSPFGIINGNGSDSYTGYLQGLKPGESGLRAILVSSNFGCEDVTNTIPLKIKGPVAGLVVGNNDACFKSPIQFQDASYGTGNVPIDDWSWSFGDGQGQDNSKGSSVAHTYSAPGYYYVLLTVTDADGCSASTATSYSNYVEVSGPQAAFTYSPSIVSPGTTVYFYNTTNNTGAYDTQYEWSFGDGTSSANSYPSYTYNSIGTDTVKLIAQSNSTQCRDTAVEVLYVKIVHASFTYTTSYINNNSCPPVVVRFSNTSVNANSISWNFGDGSNAANQAYPSHTYYQPGVYNVVLYGYGNNGAIDSVVVPITISGPYAQLQADTLSGCVGQSVTLSAIVRNASSFTWDFADGTLSQTQDTFAVHQYLTGGLYSPALIMKDQNGCQVTSALTGQIIIDSLSADLESIPPHVCVSTQVTLYPDISSLAVNQLQQTLQYQWNFGTGVPADTSISPTPSFTWYQTGLYPISLRVSSPYGCIKIVTNTLLVAAPQPFRLQLATDTFACPDKSIQLEAGGAASYSWINTAGLSNAQQADPIAAPPLQASYTVVGYDPYQCFTDTATVKIHMASLPTVSVGPQHYLEVLTGSTLPFDATGSSDVIQWNWSPPDGLSCTDCASTVCTPRASTVYTITGTTQYGCQASDTLTLKLICDEGRVYIPNSFTPNNDGKNDVFYIKGRGIRVIKYLRIFNRWGEVIFERSNFNIDDRSSGWDGTFKGHPVESGAYVYLTEMVCDSGETFPLKGAFMVIR